MRVPEYTYSFISKNSPDTRQTQILVSLKGPAGGFVLTEDQEELTMLEIVRVIDGLDIFDRCGIGLKSCSDHNPCPIHHDYKLIKQNIKKLLNQKTISDLCADVESGNSIVNFIQTT